MSALVSDAVFRQPFLTLTAPDNGHVLRLVHRIYEWTGIVFHAPKSTQYGLDYYIFR
jgi:hypothetical protein